MPTAERSPWFFPLATFVLAVAILRMGQEVLIPVAFAILLAFLLSPLVVRLGRWGLHKSAAITVTVIVAFSVIGGVGWLVTSQAYSLIRSLPDYEQNIQKKIATLKQPHAPPAVSRMAGMIDNLRKEIQAPDPQTANASPAEVKPQPVVVYPTPPTSLEVATDIVSPILGRLGIAGIVIVFVVAILFQREDLRDRFIKIVSAGKLNIATEAVDDAASRVSRYLGMQLVVNATYGIPVGLGLYFIGIPSAPLWGLLATLLRFIPFVGPWIAAVFPLALSLAVDPGWTMFGYTAALFLVMELISNNLIEVVLYGASTGISNFALLVAAVFWTWLWGPAGLVLSTPLTVCLLVLGNHVPGFKVFSMALGSEPVLEPPAQFYQRMLSMESEDMLELANKFISERSLEEFYDEVFTPALLLSEQDRHSGALAEERQEFIFQASRELIEELERQEETARQKALTPSTTPFEPAKPATPLVLGVPARDQADEIVALMLCHLLRRRGVPASATTLITPIDDIAATIARHGVKAAFISSLPPSALVGARLMWRRLTARCPKLPTLVGIWQPDNTMNDLTTRLGISRPDEIVTSLKQAMEHLDTALQMPGSFTRSPLELTDDPGRLAPPGKRPAEKIAAE